MIEDYGYDGFDRIGEHRKLVSGSLVSTRYAYDPLDRTVSRTEKAGTPAAKTTEFAYLGLSDQLLDERVAGTLTKSYQYGAGGQRVSQTTVAADGSKTDGFYGYNAHTDVETVTDSAGDTGSTYGYTAYGSNDPAGFTGIDKPDPATPDKPADNVYRYNAKRWDPVTGSYDMPPGWLGTDADNGKGIRFQRPGAKGNADMIRIMEPTRLYPDGYVVVYNSANQPIDVNGKPAGPADTHIPETYRGLFRGWPGYR